MEWQHEIVPPDEGRRSSICNQYSSAIGRGSLLEMYRRVSRARESDAQLSVIRDRWPATWQRSSTALEVESRRHCSSSSPRASTVLGDRVY